MNMIFGARKMGHSKVTNSIDISQATIARIHKEYMNSRQTSAAISI